MSSGRVGQGVKTKNALRLEVGNSLKKVNRDNKCNLKKANRGNKCNLKEPHKESPAQGLVKTSDKVFKDSK